MKLLSLYIDNFGKLSDYKFDFNKDLNSIYEENGWGKTTLTVFIKAMLYGLNKNERLKYTPWKALTSFGGELVIEVGKKEYRIIRNFNPKKASLDEFHIYDLKTNLEVTMDSNLGEKFLNLNDTSFERSVFIPEAELSDGFGSDIEAKLANLIGGTNDSESFESAIEILKNKTHLLKLNSKKGLIIDKKNELFDVESQISDLDNKINEISELENEITRYDSDIQVLNDKKKKINKNILEFSKNQERISKLKLLDKYDNDIKEAEDILNKNNEVFNGIAVTQDEVLQIREKNKKLQSLRLEYEVLKRNQNTDEKLKDVSKMINSENMPSPETLHRIERKVDKYKQVKNVIESHKEQPKKKKPIVGIILVIISSLIFIGGLTSLVWFFLNKDTKLCLYLGISLLSVSAFGFIASLAAFLVNNSRNQNRLIGGHLKSYDFELKSLSEEIRAFFFKYHLYSSDFSNNLYLIKLNIAKYNEILKERDLHNDSYSSIEKEIKLLNNEILHFLGQFNSSPNLGIEERIGELNTHLRNQDLLFNQLLEKRDLKQAFIVDNDLKNIKELNFNLDSLNSELENIDNELNDINKEKMSIESTISQYDALKAKQEELKNNAIILKDEIVNLENEFRILELSIKYLTESQNNLLEKYVKPMKDSVNKYVKLFFKNDDDYSIDVNFKFKFLTKNGLKDIDQFSRGYQMIISLCMRFALIDCLYNGEKPFIILDDPFVSFDDEKLKLSIDLLKNISKDYQIVYFTCHKSRIL